jgi:3-hydroxyisobutyrate dehydrogenase
MRGGLIVTDKRTLGFVGLGAMGGPMCRNLIKHCASPTFVYDVDESRMICAVAEGAQTAKSVAELVERVDIVFLCLPGEPEVRDVAFGRGRLAECVRAGQTIVDMSTATVRIAHELNTELARRGVDFADAPVANGVPSAVDGSLSIMVGAGADVFRRIKPYLGCMGTEVNHCGDVGTGQVVKLMNNMLLFQTVSALAETLAVGTRAGVDGQKLFEVLSKGSADSFALRRHGAYMAERNYPDDLFPSRYSLKDLDYALQLASEMGVEAHGAELAASRLRKVIDRGLGNRYSPVIYELFQMIEDDKCRES